MNRIIEHFKNPRNYGKMQNPDLEGSYGNEVCGDYIKIFLKINGNKILKISFEGAGCSVAMASASILTERIAGKSLDYAKKIDENKFIKKELGNLNKSRQYCASICIKALKNAVEKNNNKT